MLELDGIGNILLWTAGKRTIIPQQRTDTKKSRGGSFVACPVHGKVPKESLAWKGVMLEQHGLLRHGLGMAIHVDNPRCYRNCFDFKFHHEPSIAYPWSFLATIETKLEPHGQKSASCLTYGILLNRNHACKNATVMPYSIGLHPYFKVPNKHFKVYANGGLVVDGYYLEDDGPKSIPLIGLWNEVLIDCRTHKLVMTIYGADEIMIWSDNSEQHICVEPVYGRLLGASLKPGDYHHLLTKIVVED